MSLKVPASNDGKKPNLDVSKDTHNNLSRTRQTEDMFSRDTKDWKKAFNQECFCFNKEEEREKPL